MCSSIISKESKINSKHVIPALTLLRLYISKDMLDNSTCKSHQLIDLNMQISFKLTFPCVLSNSATFFFFIYQIKVQNHVLDYTSYFSSLSLFSPAPQSSLLSPSLSSMLKAHVDFPKWQFFSHSTSFYPYCYCSSSGFYYLDYCNRLGSELPLSKSCYSYCRCNFLKVSLMLFPWSTYRMTHCLLNNM